MKCLHVEITIDNGDGTATRRSLDGDEAQRWNQMNGEVALQAFIHGFNPKWESLPWVEKTEAFEPLPAIEEETI